MLPFVAVLLVALMGIAALSVDLGLAFAQQARVESFAETLALELDGAAEQQRFDPEDADAGAEMARRLLGDLFGEGVGTTAEAPGPSALAPSYLHADHRLILRREVPVLFGAAAVPGLRARGLDLLGSARVESNPATAVGIASAERGLPGIADFAVSAEAWSSLRAELQGGDVTLERDQNGALRIRGGQEVGREVDPSRARVVGSLVRPPTRPPEARPPSRIYVPVYGGDRVIGFFEAWESTAGATRTLRSIELANHGPPARINATASLAPIARALIGESDEVIRAVLEARSSFQCEPHCVRVSRLAGEGS